MNYSIIIPSKNRAELIASLLKSLSVARSKTQFSTEVLIIDDSDLENSEKIKNSAKQYDCKVVTKSCSVAQKRNFGASLSSYDTLLFLDSDVRVSPNLLIEYDKVYEEKRAKMAVGALEFDGEKHWYWDAVNASPFTKCFYMPKGEPELKWGCSCNLSVDKKLFEEVGGFCEDFKDPAGEDVDFGLRISDRHIKIHSVPKAVVYHSNETWRHFNEMKRRVSVYGKADVLLVKRHPEQVVSCGIFKRVTMYWGVALLSLLFAVLLNCYWLLFMPVGYYALENIGVALIAKHQYRRFGKISLLKELAVQNLIHINERAYLRQCIMSGKFGFLNKQLIYMYGQACSTLKFSRYTMFLQWFLLFSVLTIVLIIAII